MPQVDVAFTEDGFPYGTIVACPRKDCKERHIIKEYPRPDHYMHGPTVGRRR